MDARAGRIRGWFLAFLMFALVLTACGGEDGNATSSPFVTLTPLPPTAAPTVVAAQATPTPMADPDISPTSTPATFEPLPGHSLGPADAYLTIVMYGDFQCGLCARYARDLEIMRSRHPNDIRLIWRHLPDARAHANTELALQASEAAAAQDRFWDMHDQLFTHQAEWAALSPDDFRATLSDYAQTVGLDVAQFDADLDTGAYADISERARREASELGMMGAPLLLFNGIPYTGRDDLFGLDETARLALLERRHYDIPPAMIIDPQKSYRATLITEKGDIVIELNPQAAPIAVNNFVFLAREGWYNNVTFHTVVPDFFAQTGDPSDTGRGSPGYAIPDEHDNGLAFDRAGLVAMAHPMGIENSAGSEFFITLASIPEWNGQYTIFGEVVSGLDVAQRLTARNPNDPVAFPNPPPGDRMMTVTIEELE